MYMGNRWSATQGQQGRHSLLHVESVLVDESKGSARHARADVIEHDLIVRHARSVTTFNVQFSSASILKA